MTHVEKIEGHFDYKLGISDLDSRFHLKLDSVVRNAAAGMYSVMYDAIGDSMRHRAIAGLIRYADFRLEAVPLAVDQLLHTGCEVRIGRGGNPSSSDRGLLQRIRLDMTSAPGTGNMATIREVLGGSPVLASKCEFVLAYARPFAPPAERVVRDVPIEIAHLQLQEFGDAVPPTAQLLCVPEGQIETSGVAASPVRHLWSTANTDVNGVVYTGSYLAQLEQHHAEALFEARMPPNGYRVGRLQVLFNRPFFAGEQVELRCRLWTAASEIVAHVTMHLVGADGKADPRPGIAARITAEVL